jgi:peptidoglycan hydrolase-like protein with peptidoglycan-binding domain
VCVLGNYDASPLPRHAIEDLADWARWHGNALGPNKYRGHRDVTATACPGKNLYNVMRDINLYAEQDYAPPANPAPELPPTLRLGSTGGDVVFLQAALMAHDGIFGPTTDAVVRAYQSAHGLTVDGICGPQTWRSILKL